MYQLYRKQSSDRNFHSTIIIFAVHVVIMGYTHISISQIYLYKAGFNIEETIRKGYSNTADLKENTWKCLKRSLFLLFLVEFGSCFSIVWDCKTNTINKIKFALTANQYRKVHNTTFSIYMYFWRWYKSIIFEDKNFAYDINILFVDSWNTGHLTKDE